MSRLVASFDPSAGSGTFQAGAINKCSTLWVMNESPNFISLDFGGAGTTKIVQPWYNMQISLPNPVQTVNWSVLATLQSGSAPVSMVYVELFDPAETVSSLLSGPLFRQSNVGNAAAVSASASAVQNDGNAANTTILEGTPSGAASSQALITNDGRAILGGGNVTISTAGVFTLPAGAVPVASLAGGTLPSGVSVPAAQVGSGYPGANISGAVANATNATNASNATIAQYLAANSGAGGFEAVDDSAGGNTRLEPSADRDTVLTYRDTGGVSHDVASFSQYGLQMAAGMPIVPTNGGALHGLNHISGSGSATVNHGLSTTPSAAVVNTNNGQNSTTFGSGSYTSTTVYIYQYGAQPWTGVVYV